MRYLLIVRRTPARSGLRADLGIDHDRPILLRRQRGGDERIDAAVVEDDCEVFGHSKLKPLMDTDQHGSIRDGEIERQRDEVKEAAAFHFVSSSLALFVSIFIRVYPCSP